MDLIHKKCAPCEGGTKPFTKEKTDQYLKLLSNPWEVIDRKTIQYRFKLKGFKGAIDFVNKIANIAESEGHHPDFTINYNKVTISLSTHAIGGLSENDFILAAKIEQIH